MPNGPERFVPAAHGPQNDRRLVGAPIVHIDDFAYGNPGRCGLNLGQERLDIVLLIEDRYDDGNHMANTLS